MKIKSILNELLEKLNCNMNLKEVKEISITYIATKEIKEIDQKKMIFEITRIDSIERLYQYLVNCLLKYEGNGILKTRR